MPRIDEICSHIDRCETFADVGCDHGFCTQYALNNGLCQKAYITDISVKSLEKAVTLLKDFISKGRCVPVCCDGLASVPKDTDQVLIAGMGGNEIIKILKEGFIPRKFILQPMKNASLVREFLIERGCKITYDGIFKDQKFYFLIKGESEGTTEAYTPCQLQFGKDSLNNPVFYEYAENEIKKKLEYTKCGGSEEILQEIFLLKEYLNECKRRIENS